MTLASIEARLRKAEQRHGLHGDIERMTDAQLWRIVRRGYRDLCREHGSLAHAILVLRATGSPDDASLAALIEEDTGGSDAVHH